MTRAAARRRAPPTRTGADLGPRTPRRRAPGGRRATRATRSRLPGPCRRRSGRRPRCPERWATGAPGCPPSDDRRSGGRAVDRRRRGPGAHLGVFPYRSRSSPILGRWQRAACWRSLLLRVGGALFGSCGLVDEDGDAVAGHLRVGEPQAPFVVRVPEESLARSEDEGKYRHPQLVNKVVLEERLHELGAAVDHNVPSKALPQPRDLLHHVALEHRRVVPIEGLLEGRGDDVLGHGVELVGDLALHRGPGRGEALVGHTSQQQRLGVQGLVELELLELLPAFGLEGPARVPEVLASAWRLDDTVQRNVLGCDYLSHLDPPQIPQISLIVIVDLLRSFAFARLLASSRGHLLIGPRIPLPSIKTALLSQETPGNTSWGTSRW